jgi:hypothetical protein
MSGNGAYPDEMDFSQPEIASFSRAVRATLVREADPAASAVMVRRLADEARASATVAAERTERTSTAPLRSGRRTRPRRRLALVAVAVLALPLLTAGLAAAGVRLPDAADSAFETVGIELPNQGTGDDPADQDQGSGNDGEPAASPAAEPGGENAVKGDRRQGNGPPEHSNAGGNQNPGSNSGGNGNGKAKGKPAAPPGQTKPKPPNNAGGNGKAVGQGGTPPGQAKKPAGSGDSGSAGNQGQGEGGGKPPK